MKAFLLLAMLPLAVPAFAQSGDAPPSTPTGLVAGAYSGTAGGVRWNRSTDDRGAVPGYEISRDGVLLGVRDTLSVVEKNLDPGTTYVYAITAIDNAGQRSGTATVSLTTDGGPAPGPAAPADLRASVYSRTAAEIFWTRPTTFGLRYEVRRDGTRIGTTDGTSWFDDSLTRGPTYTYDILAIDRQGRRSGASTIALDTVTKGPVAPPTGDDPFAVPDPAAATVVARLGYAAARDLADDLVSSGYLSLYYDIDTALRLFLAESLPFGDDVATSCPGGGTVSGDMATFLFDVTFDGCRIEDRTLSGDLALESTYIVFGSGDAQEATLTFDDLSVEAGDARRLQLTGTSRRLDNLAGGGPCGGPPDVTHEVENRIGTALVESADDVSIVADATWTQRTFAEPRLIGDPAVSPCIYTDTLTFEGETSVVSTLFGERVATFGKRGEIVRDRREGSASEGSARLDADFGDGSTLAVSSDGAGDTAGEAQVDIVAEGVAVSFADDYRFEAREDVPTILGD